MLQWPSNSGFNRLPDNKGRHRESGLRPPKAPVGARLPFFPEVLRRACLER